jgi:hypothetical protein
MPIDRRKFVTIGAGALLTSRYSQNIRAAGNERVSAMLKPAPGSPFTADVLMTTGDNIDGYRPPGIMDGMGAWDWDAQTVRLFVNHELGSKQGYTWELDNGTRMRGARISWFDIDKQTREIRAAGPAIKEIRDRRGEIVTRTTQINEEWEKESEPTKKCLPRKVIRKVARYGHSTYATMSCGHCPNSDAARGKMSPP